MAKWRNPVSKWYRRNSRASFKVIGTNCGCQIRVPKVTKLFHVNFSFFHLLQKRKLASCSARQCGSSGAQSFLREIPVHFNNYLGFSRRVSTKNPPYFRIWRLNFWRKSEVGLSMKSKSYTGLAEALPDIDIQKFLKNAQFIACFGDFSKTQCKNNDWIKTSLSSVPAADFIFQNSRRRRNRL